MYQLTAAGIVYMSYRWGPFPPMTTCLRADPPGDLQGAVEILGGLDGTFFLTVALSDPDIAIRSGAFRSSWSCVKWREGSPGPGIDSAICLAYSDLVTKNSSRTLLLLM